MTAWVPPLLARLVSESPKNAWRHCLRARTRRATSGTGHEVKLPGCSRRSPRPAGGVLVVHGAHPLGAPVGEFDLDVPLVGAERRVEPGLLPVGQVPPGRRAGCSEYNTRGCS